MAQNKTCFFAKRRSEKNAALKNLLSTIDLTKVNSNLQESQKAIYVYVHVHTTSVRCAIENFCCCPISLDHSKFLIKCPKRFFEVFDEEGKTLQGYKPGTMICKKCFNIADNYFASHPAYIGPAKRKMVIIMYSSI